MLVETDSEKSFESAYLVPGVYVWGRSFPLLLKGSQRFVESPNGCDVTQKPVYVPETGTQRSLEVRSAGASFSYFLPLRQEHGAVNI
jgi:hypothetical protein